MNRHELLVSARDAEVLAGVVSAHRRMSHRLEADASDALTELLMDARFVPHEALPSERVALHSTVTYAEEPAGARRTITLTVPQDAAPADGRISVLSPIGLALFGRRLGAVLDAAMPNGRTLRIRLLGETS